MSSFTEYEALPMRAEIARLPCIASLVSSRSSFLYNVCVCLLGAGILVSAGPAVVPSEAQAWLPASSYAQLGMPVVPQKGSSVAQVQRTAAILEPPCQGMLFTESKTLLNNEVCSGLLLSLQCWLKCHKPRGGDSIDTISQMSHFSLSSNVDEMQAVLLHFYKAMIAEQRFCFWAHVS